MYEIRIILLKIQQNKISTQKMNYNKLHKKNYRKIKFCSILITNKLQNKKKIIHKSK